MDAYHVIPLNDLIEHTDSLDCPCDPKAEVRENGVLVVHNALDRREIFEQRAMYNEGGATPSDNTTCNSCGRLINSCECMDSNGHSIWKKLRGNYNA